MSAKTITVFTEIANPCRYKTEIGISAFKNIEELSAFENTKKQGTLKGIEKFQPYHDGKAAFSFSGRRFSGIKNAIIFFGWLSKPLAEDTMR